MVAVTLNDVQIQSWKADNQGNLIAKFAISAIKNLPLNIRTYNTLTLKGTKVYGETSIVFEDIPVINLLPSGKQ